MRIFVVGIFPRDTDTAAVSWQAFKNHLLSCFRVTWLLLCPSTIFTLSGLPNITQNPIPLISIIAQNTQSGSHFLTKPTANKNKNYLPFLLFNCFCYSESSLLLKILRALSICDTGSSTIHELSWCLGLTAFCFVNADAEWRIALPGVSVVWGMRMDGYGFRLWCASAKSREHPYRVPLIAICFSLFSGQLKINVVIMYKYCLELYIQIEKPKCS